MCISYYMKEKGGVLQKLSDCFTEDGQYVDRAERRGLFSSLSKKSYGLFRMTNYRRNKMKKRIFCFFLAITMMIALLPTMALAETITSGKCGENATWSYDQTTKTLTIAGSGAMDDYKHYMMENSAPWSGLVYGVDNDLDIANEVETVIIGSDITRVGNEAFGSEDTASYPKLKNIIFAPNSSVTEIGAWAFAGAEALEEITLPKSLQAIKGGEYYYPILTAFPSEALKAIYVEDGNKIFYSDEGVLYKGTEMGLYPPKKDAAQYDILSGTTEVSFMIATTFLQSVSIPGSVKKIPDDMFLRCKNLREVSLSEGTEEVSSSAFWGCASLRRLDIPVSVTQFNMDSDLIHNASFCDEDSTPLDIYFSGMVAPEFETNNKGVAICATKILPGKVTIHYPAQATGWDAVQAQENVKAAVAEGLLAFEPYAEEHTHVFDQEVVKAEALQQAADCTHDAVYYKSCACGAVGTSETFTAADTALGHDWADTLSKNTENHWYMCKRCDEKKDVTAHDFNEEGICTVCKYHRDAPITYRVTFDSKGGSVVENQEINADGTVTVPIAPTKSGYRFTGWFKDEACTAEYDFTIPVVRDITLYAGWHKKSGSSGGGGGGGSAAVTYPIEVASAEHGAVSADKTKAEKGTTVTITAKADGGYVLDEMKATDKDGKEIKLEDKGEGVYTFDMPASAVEIKAAFKEEKTPATEEPSKGEKKEIVIKMQIGNKNIDVNGKTITNDAAPIIRNDRTLIPIRFITESLGGKVDWNGVTKEVTLTIDGKEIKMTIGKTLEKYGVAPIIIDGRTFVPVRFVADELGAAVAWDDATKTVTITKIEK